MCEAINSPHILPGWVCCQCRIYNGPQRAECKHCGRTHCPNIDRVALAKKTNAVMGRAVFVIDDGKPKVVN
jgi:hypothetical protein